MSETGKVRYPLGQSGHVWRDNYDPAAEYFYLHAVKHGNAVWMWRSRTPGTGVEPGTDPVRWQLLLISATTLELQAAQAAQLGAETARDQAQTARDEAETARTGAQDAQAASETAREEAAESQTKAATSETNALESAGIAQSMAAQVASAMRGEQLFDNWDWRDPVNRRGGGVSGAISTPGDFLERWRLVSGTVTVNADNMQFSAGAKIEQRTLRRALAGKEVTVSVMLLDGSIKQGTGIMPTSGAVSVPIDGFGTAVLGYHADYLYTQLQAAAAVTALAGKLEIGNTSTLMADPPMDKAQMLTVCANYYRIVSMMLVPIITTRLQGASWPEMHKTPTVVLYPGAATIDWSRPNYIAPYNNLTDYKQSNSPSNITTSGFMFCNTTSTLELGQWYRANAVIDASL